MKTRTLLFDADIFAFKAAAATEGVFHFNGRDSAPAVEENLERALATADRLLERVAVTLKSTRVVICLTDKENFRYSVLPSYKSNRKSIRRPSTLGMVKQHFADKYETYQRPGLEADDCMGILSTHPTLIPGEKIVVSSDKDMKTIPGLLFNPDKDTKVPRRITELDANRYFLVQTLTGDSTDGYKGCPGIGGESTHVANVQAAGTLKEMWGAVVAGYESKSLTAAEALVQARCARILRASDWDFQNKAVRLWNPPV